MFLKMLKQEIKTQGKTILATYAALAIATILMVAAYLASKMVGGGVLESVFMVLSAVYMMTIIAVVVVDFVYLCFHFYQSMYSAQGYLTHTLPLKTTEILHVKLAVSFGYLFLTGICGVLSFVSIVMTAGGIPIGTVIEAVKRVLHSASQQIGISETVFVIYALALIILTYLNALLLFFAGSSIGQLFHRSKAACGIAASIGLYYFNQIFSIIMIFAGYLLTTKISALRGAAWPLAGSCLLVLVQVMIYYMICRIIVQKHLNLE